MSRKKKALEIERAMTTLHLEPGATLEDVKDAYRRLALKFHPDRVETEAEKKEASKDFQIIKKAYDILMEQNLPSREKEKPVEEIHEEPSAPKPEPEPEPLVIDPDDVMIGEKVEPVVEEPEPVQKKKFNPQILAYFAIPIGFLIVWTAIKINHFTPLISAIFNWSAPFWTGYFISFAVLAYLLSFFRWELEGVEAGYLPIAAIGSAGTVLPLYLDHSNMFGYEFIIFLSLLSVLYAVVIWSIRRILAGFPRNFALIISIPAAIVGMKLAWTSEHSAQIPKRVKTESVPVLMKIAKKSDTEKRVLAVKLLSEIGMGAQDSLPFLRTLLYDPDFVIRSSANDAIQKIESAVQMKSLFELIQKLKNETPKVRSDAAVALGKLGSFAKEAVPALTETLKDSDSQVSDNAYKALRIIDRDEKVKSLPFLKDSLKNGNAENQLEVVNKIIEVAKVDDSGIDALEDVLRVDSLEARFHAIDALESLGIQSGKAATLLVATLKDRDKSVRKKGALSLLNLNRFDPDALPIYREMLRDSDASVRYQVIRAFGNMGEVSNPAVPDLAEAMKDADPQIRSAASGALEKIDTKESRRALRASGR